jgi:lysophospholipid acyltransferase (LPLAT)-like uncharacterized protein
MAPTDRILRSDRLRRFVCWLVAVYIRLVWATSRWRIERGDIPRRLHDDRHPFILAFWHGRLLMMPMAWDRAQPIHMLISSHRDGRIIADAVKHFGIGSIAGSSRRGGSSALRQMMKRLRDGDCVGITPDGPRGPAAQASDGIIAAARLAQVPIVPLAYAARRRRVLRSWDRFHLPVPFNSGVFVWGEPILVPAGAADLECHRRLVEDRMNALALEADRLVLSPSPPLGGEGRGEGACGEPSVASTDLPPRPGPLPHAGTRGRGGVSSA